MNFGFWHDYNNDNEVGNVRKPSWKKREPIRLSPTKVIVKGST